MHLPTSFQHWLIAPPAQEKYTSNEDTVVLEDESGRVALTGDIFKETMLVTGVAQVCPQLDKRHC